MTDVVVVGSIHIDRMIRVDTLPEPGETGVATEAWTQLGGKAANQAIASAMHVPTALVACVGPDLEADQVLEMLERGHVQTRVRRSLRLPTGSSVAMVDARGENFAVISMAANEELSASDVRPVIDDLRPSVVLCQWESPLQTLHDTLAGARTTECTTILNAAPWRETHRPVLSLADHVVVNSVEAAAWAGSELESLPPVAPFAHPSVIVTLGSRGAAYYRDGRLEFHQPAARVKARSTHGAGDHFVGALAAGLAKGLPLAATLRTASDSAGEWVQSLHKNVMQGAAPSSASCPQVSD